MMKDTKLVASSAVVLNQFFWAICVVASMLVLPLAVGAATLTGTETQVTNAKADQFDPAISGNIVVYTDFSGVDADVWYTDLSTGLAKAISTASGDQQLTGVSDNHIVYTDWNTMDVLVFDIMTGVTQNLTNAAGSNSLDPAIGGTIVAWTDDRDGNAEIYAKDLSTGEERRITNNVLVDEAPAVGDGIVVWERCDGYACDVFAYEWATATTTQITATPWASEHFPDVSGRKVAFQREQGTPIDKNIVVFDLDSGIETVLQLAGDQENAHISGDFVSFNDSASGVPHIGLWQLSTGEHFQVTENASGQYLNDIYGNRIVYSDNRAGTLDIWMFTFSIESSNHPPTLSSIGDQIVMEGQTLTFTVAANDPDNDTLAYWAGNLPTGATFDPVTRTFSWTPDYGQAGNYPNVLFTVTDNGSPVLSASETITITVGNVNRPPVLDPIGSKSIIEGETLQFSLSAYDPDGDGITFAAGNLPSGATFDPITQTFTWIPAYNQARNYAVRFTVTDDGSPQESATEEITISVGNVNRPPVLSPIGNQTINEGQSLTIVITATDPDGEALTYSANNLPSGATFDPISQTFVWTPAYSQAGTYQNVEFTVTDNGNPAELDVELIEITVGNTNRAPVFTTVGTQGVQENQLLQFNVKATDPDGDAIVYSTGPLPTGASFNASAGLFSWTPSNTQSGNYSVVFYASDGGGLSGQTEVSIAVGETTTPCDLADQIIQTVLGLHLRKAVENSYMANLKKVCKFVQDGKVFQAIIQLDVFIAKVVIDIAQRDISLEAGKELINMAMRLINLLRN
jgi:beta propeller repeat protein